MYVLIKHKTIDTPKIVNIFILNVLTISSSHLQKNATYVFTKPTIFKLDATATFQHLAKK